MSMASFAEGNGDLYPTGSQVTHGAPSHRKWEERIIDCCKQTGKIERKERETQTGKGNQAFY